MSTQKQKAIEKMYKILSDEKRWTKDAYARDARGNKVSPRSGSAASFCLIGASMASNLDSGLRISALDLLSSLVGCLVHHFNDRIWTGHDDVLALLRRAHKEAGSGEPEVYL